VASTSIAAPSDRDPPDRDPSARGPAAVLLVDDDDAVRRIAAVIIAELGFRVIEAPDAAKALAALRGPDRIDLLMTDLAMPDIGGLELALMAREVRPGLPILYTSAYGRAAKGNPAMRFGGFIEKPWRRDGLLGALATVLGPAPR
jgi:DNA-binding NtrC family response regulator